MKAFFQLVVTFIVAIMVCLIGIDAFVEYSGFKSNRDTGIDTHMTFNVAYIDLGTEIVKVPVASWRDFGDEEQLQVTTPNGVTYLTGSGRMVLVYEPPVQVPVAVQSNETAVVTK